MRAAIAILALAILAVLADRGERRPRWPVATGPNPMHAGTENDQATPVAPTTAHHAPAPLAR
jgi:hypothetical protein